MQASIYCRVSSEEQATDNNYSLENQEKRGRDCCESRENCRVAYMRKAENVKHNETASVIN
jgi:DNA invertase Pin-like site-specific DNA recombinase